MAATSRSIPVTIDARDVDGIEVLEVAGELDLSSAPELCARIEQALHRAPRVVVDLSGLEFCDSTGLRALLGAARVARIRLAEVCIVPPSGSAAARAFELAGASDFLPLIDRAPPATGGV